MLKIFWRIAFIKKIYYIRCIIIKRSINIKTNRIMKKWEVNIRKENNTFFATLSDKVSGESLEVKGKTPEKCALKLAPYIEVLTELKCGGAEEITLDELKMLVA